jgi:hypothetical protein
MLIYIETSLTRYVDAVGVMMVRLQVTLEVVSFLGFKFVWFKLFKGHRASKSNTYIYICLVQFLYKEGRIYYLASLS